jgi:hypothetical protein
MTRRAQRTNPGGMIWSAISHAMCMVRLQVRAPILASERSFAPTSFTTSSGARKDICSYCRTAFVEASSSVLWRVRSVDIAAYARPAQLRMLALYFPMTRRAQRTNPGGMIWSAISHAMCMVRLQVRAPILARSPRIGVDPCRLRRGLGWRDCPSQIPCRHVVLRRYTRRCLRPEGPEFASVVDALRCAIEIQRGMLV